MTTVTSTDVVNIPIRPKQHGQEDPQILVCGCALGTRHKPTLRCPGVSGVSVAPPGPRPTLPAARRGVCQGAGHRSPPHAWGGTALTPRGTEVTPIRLMFPDAKLAMQHKTQGILKFLLHPLEP